MLKENNKILRLINWIINFGVPSDLAYLESRKYKLINLIVSSVALFLIIFFFINIAQSNYFLAASDIAMLILVCVPSWILQYKKKYVANLVLITSAFFVYTTALTLLNYDVNRQTEHVLPAISIMAIFLFDGWKKNLLYIFFPISFFTIRFVTMYETTGEIKLELIHLIYFIEFLAIYTITSFFKADMTSFYKTLVKSNQTKTKLLRIMSHDLRNPFNSLLGTSKLQAKFIESGDMEKLKLSSTVINSSANKIYNLTQTLLDWSMSQSDSLKSKIEKINLTDLTKQVIDFSNITAVHKEIKIEFNPTSPIFCYCDNIMTQICLRNIIMNAIKFSSRESKIIVSQHIKDGSYEIHVQDFGVGISNEDIEKVFDDTTIHSSYGTENEKGTGLGIKICKELMEHQGGKLLAESTINLGSLFKLQFPVKF